jgi:hypothetical protein
MSAAPERPQQSEGRREGAFLSREEWALAQGKKVCGPPLRLGQRGEAVLCQPKPIDEVVIGGGGRNTGKRSQRRTLAHSLGQAAPYAGIITISIQNDAPPFFQ